MQHQVYYISIDIKHTLITPYIHTNIVVGMGDTIREPQKQENSNIIPFLIFLRSRFNLNWNTSFCIPVTLCRSLSFALTTHTQTHIPIQNIHTHANVESLGKCFFFSDVTHIVISFSISAKASELGEYNSTQKHYSYITSIQVQ